MSVLATQRIIHRLSYSHTSEQNGVAERKHQHIVDIGGFMSSSGPMSTFVPLVKSVPSWPMEFSSALPPASSSSPNFFPSPSVSNDPQAKVGSDHELLSSSSLPNGDGVPSPTVPTTNIPSSSFISSSSLPLTNTHSMVTRSKAGIFKPKALPVEAIEPHTIEEAFSTTKWRATA
ncbi:protein NRT1/PTR FAMILY 6.2-like [Gossypium australe]|uniref:Protein NRT1/PTR FAMILY 6.2-like n=1 Tax=Gossypium australe TaxID=47621 RepID=A0A5B6VZG9_9ROSI|nr:protein NRT1/PTR FAMILY 6.2-like [Gossypium australe]